LLRAAIVLQARLLEVQAAMFGFCQSFAQSRYINVDSPMALRSESPAGSPSFKTNQNQPSISVSSEASSEEVGSVINGDPGHLDILMGRAKNSQQHSGNLIFQKLILANIKAYTNKTRGGKGQIVKRLLAFLRLEKKVRFLKRLDDGTYVEILDLKVLNDKVSHALRDVQFFDGSKYCPPDADEIVKEFEAFAILRSGVKYVTKNKLNSPYMADAVTRQKNATQVLSPLAMESPSTTEINDITNHFESENLPRGNDDVGKANFYTHTVPEDNRWKKRSSVSSRECKRVKKNPVDPVETEKSEEEKVPPTVFASSPKIRRDSLQTKKIPNYNYPLKDPPQSERPISVPPAPQQRTMAVQSTQSYINTKDQHNYENFPAQWQAQNQLEQLQVHRSLQSQLEQLHAHDKMQMEQLRAAQQARRDQLMLSHGTSAARTREPSSKASLLQNRGRPSAAAAVLSPVAEKPRYLSGMELLSDVIHVLNTAPDASPSADLQMPQLLSSLSAQSKQEVLSLLGVLNSSRQNQTGQIVGPSFALAHFFGCRDPMVLSQLAAPGSAPEVKPSRFGGYPFP